MTSNIVPFDFNSRQVRVVMIEGDPWFVAKDVLGVIESSTKVTDLETMISEGLGKEFVSNEPLPTAGGIQTVLILSMPALTFFVSRSRTELGKRFNLWIHTVVVPSIFKTGSYSATPKPFDHSTLPPADIRITNLTNSLLNLGIDIQNPRYKQCLQDLVMDKILGETTSSLPASQEVWLGVAEKAERMGYSATLVGRHRSQLGKYVASFPNFSRRREERLCNGTMRAINLYQDCPELEQAVREFMDAKVLAA